MIEAELRIWKLLNTNMNVVRLLGVVRTYPNSIYILPWPVSEYHKNNDMKKYLREQSADEWRRFQLLTGIIRGLAHIHSLSIVHGDLKASNIVVNDDGGEAKICDFGSSRIFCKCYDGPENQDGTAQWDSPEIWDGEPRTAPSDIWAFGCVALEIQFSQHPYDFSAQKSQVMQMKGYLPATKRPANLEVHSISNKVWHLMQHCWSTDSETRPDAQTLLTDFEALRSSNV
ncbi:kinase-like protein [Ceratobasidium sp. AG-I]|nr:kinase-like protein [Ceratobasidium sp. AG-I]